MVNLKLALYVGLPTTDAKASSAFQLKARRPCSGKPLIDQVRLIMPGTPGGLSLIEPDPRKKALLSRPAGVTVHQGCEQ